MRGMRMNSHVLARRLPVICITSVSLIGSPAFSAVQGDVSNEGLAVYREVIVVTKKAESLVKAGRAEEAIDLYERVMEKIIRLKEDNPRWNNAATERNIKLCREKIGHLIKTMRPAREESKRSRPSDAEKIVERAKEIEREEIRERSKGEAGKWSLRRLFRREGDKEPAKGRRVELEKEQPNAGIPTTTALIFLERAQSYTKQGKHDLAIENYQKAITLGDEGIETRYGLGTAYEKLAEDLEASGKREESLEKYRDAIAEYKKVLWEKPNHIYALYSLGCVYARLGEREDALYFLKKTVQYADRKSDLASRARHDIRLLGGY
jgi:tetratricopeptide (TPR) repeat protein